MSAPGNFEIPERGPGIWQPKIQGIVCNWCSYAGADLAGGSRIQYPPDIRIVPVAVSGDATGQAEAFAVTWNGRTDTLVFNPAAAALTVNGRSVSTPMAAAIGGNWTELPQAKQ